MTVKLPQAFGRYELIRLLGEGGMAEVYLASVRVAEGLTKWVVIKKIRRDFADQTEFRSMFVDEAKIALSLNHSNIVQVFDFGQIASTFYLAMELIEGVDLMHLFHSVRGKKEPFPAVIAAYVVHQIASGVGYVHRKTDDYGQALGIVHRDITPHNVMISYDGQVKLLDFGIARAGALPSAAQSRAEFETIKGKVAYMSPEQAAGRTVDQRSDIYSMGVILYELLTGEVLFREHDRLKALERVRTEPIIPLAVRAPDLPTELIRIVDQALAHDVNERTPSARELQSQLAVFLHRSDPVVDDEALGTFLTRYHPRHGTPIARARAAGEAATREMGDSHPSESSIGIKRRSVRAVLLAASFTSDPQENAVRPADLHRFIDFTRDFAFKREAEVVELDEHGGLFAFGTVPTTQDDADRALRAAQSLRESVGAMIPGLGLGITLMATQIQVQRNLDGGESVTVPEGLPERLRQYARRFVDDRVMTSRELVDRLSRSWRFGPPSPVHSGFAQDATFAPWVADFQELAPFLGPLSEAERRTQLQLTGRRPLYGRDLELKALRDAFTDSIRGARSQTIVVTGGPGMGKRALIERFTSSLPAGGCAILRGAGLWSHRNQPLTLFLDVLRRFLHIDASTPAQELIARLQDYKVKEAEHLGNAVAVALGLSGARREGVGAYEHRELTVRLLRRLIRSLSQRRPVLLVVENLHFVDEQSLGILEEWTKNQQKLPILGVFSGRPNARLEKRFEGSDALRIHLAELDEAARRQMIVKRFEDPASADRLADAILARTGGNPLFIEETLASLLRRDVIGWSASGRQWIVLEAKASIEISPNMEAVLQDRIDALDDVSRQALQAASVLGRRFRPAELPLLLNDIHRTDIDEALQRLVTAGLVQWEATPGPDGAERMRITTVSLHDVARRSVPAQRAAVLHGLAARAKRMRADYLPGRDDGPIAEHLWQAGQSGESIEPALSAARYAKEISGSVEAYNHLSQALKALPLDDYRRFQALLDREPILRAWGHKRARGADIRQLVEFAKTYGEEQHRVLATIRLLRFYIDCGWFHRGERLVPQIEERIPLLPNPRPYRAQLGELVSSLQFSRRDFVSAERTANAALPYCDDDGAGQRQLGRLMTRMGEAQLGSGEYDKARQTFLDCLELAQKTHNRRLEAEALNHLGSVAGLTTRYQDAVQYYHQALDIDRELGDRHSTGTKLANLGIAYTAIGLYRRAERYLRKALELHEALGHPGQLHDVMISLGDAVAGLGNLDAAKALFRDAERVASNMEDKRKELRAVARLSAAMIHPHSNEAELEEAERLAKRVVQEGQARGLSTAVARGWHILSQLADREQRQAEAILLERRAVELVRDGAAPVEGVFSIHHLGRLLSDSPQTIDEGSTLLKEAADIVFDRLSALQDSELRAGYTRQPAVRRILEDGGRSGYACAP